jgi:hypothetical protein
MELSQAQREQVQPAQARQEWTLEAPVRAVQTLVRAVQALGG